MPSTGIIDRLRSDVPTPTGSSRRAIESTQRIKQMEKGELVENTHQSMRRSINRYLICPGYVALCPETPKTN